MPMEGAAWKRTTGLHQLPDLKTSSIDLVKAWFQINDWLIPIVRGIAALLPPSMVTASGQKLDEILTAIAMLTEKVDKLNSKFEAIEVRLDNIESNFNSKIKEIKNQIREKAEKMY